MNFNFTSAALLALSVVAVAPQVQAAPISIAGVDYESANFATTLASSSATGGSYSFQGANLNVAVTDLSVDTWAFCNGCSAGYLQLEFANPLVNGAGDDLVLFEIGTVDSFGVSLTSGGSPLTISTASTGFTQGGGYGINLGSFNLDLLGIAPGASVSSIFIHLGSSYAVTSSGPTLGAAVGLYNMPSEVPEPSTLGLISAGLCGLALWRRRRC
jgi:hypothetical protein